VCKRPQREFCNSSLMKRKKRGWSAYISIRYGQIAKHHNLQQHHPVRF
jgi:hypothetical protein